MSSYYNPVEITFADILAPTLAPLIRGRRCWVVTTRGASGRSAFSEVREAADSLFVGATTDVTPNPTLASIVEQARGVSAASPEVIISLGGGSVLDTAKALAAVGRVPDAEGWLFRHVRGTTPYPDDFNPIPLIAVPTTAGTGSEVTMWGSLWSPAERKKYSISHPALYAEHAVLVPALTHSLGYAHSLFPALDALSHSMEAIWNRHANPVSDGLAVDAIRTIVASLGDRYADRYGADDVRSSLQEASLKAGLAISSTRTAIAHSISYPLTAALNVPHGLACSFTLPEILRLSAGESRAGLIVRALGCSDVSAAIDRLYHVYAEVGVSGELRKFIRRRSQAVDLDADFITQGRAENGLVPVSQEGARKVIAAALEDLGV